MTITEYFQRYYNLLPFHANGEQAYIALEIEYFDKFKKNRFKTYNSFKRSKNYYFGLY
jgi:hypothetical protein